MLCGAAHDQQVVDLAGPQSRGGNRRHCAGAHDNRARAAESGRPAEPKTGLDQRAASRVDAGFGVRPLGRVQRVLDHVMQCSTGIAALLSRPKRCSDLAENLVFADEHRIETRRHREQMLGGALFVVHVHMRRQLVESDAGVPGQQLRDSGDCRMKFLHRGVELDPVAGGQHHRLVDGRRRDEVIEQLVDGVCRQRDPLEQGKRRAAV